LSDWEGQGTPKTTPTEYYATVEEADTFFEDRLGTTVWDAATDADKLKALKMATKTIDALPLAGFKLVSTQDLAFPRKYLRTGSISPWNVTIYGDEYGCVYTSEAVPQEVVNACCLEAAALLAHYASTDKQERLSVREQGIKSYSLGSAYSEDLGPLNDRFGLISEEAYKLLEKHIEISVNIR
jgi:hypothetical protein